MGKLSRTKGANFERRLARWFSYLFNDRIFRQTDETQQGNRGDIRFEIPRGCAQGLQLVVQAKHMRQPSIWAALAEAEKACSDDATDLAVACVRRHGGEDVVVMRPDVFALLIAGIPRGWKDFV